jgi:DNA-binding GntR family transcriptional regulator
MIKKKVSKSDRAYELIKEKIITLQFAPGMKLEEKLLVEELAFGRTPIREALKMLVVENLVESYGPNSTYVKNLSIKNAKDCLTILFYLGDVIFELGKLNNGTDNILKKLKNFYAYMVKALDTNSIYDFLKYNSYFHITLAGLANNDYLISFIKNIYNDEIRLSCMILSAKSEIISYKDHYEGIQEHHKEIINLIEIRQLDEAKRIYKLHIDASLRKLLTFFSLPMNV